MISTS
jgi:hypothetical protein